LRIGIKCCVSEYIGNRSLILKSVYFHITWLEKGEEKAKMLRIRAVPSLAFILIGSMDWLTTIIGISYFGAVESNPFIAGMTRTSLVTFTAVKLTTTALVALLFYKADKTLLGARDKSSRFFRLTRITLKAAYVIATVLLLAAVLNNLIVVARAI
jgi:hypothetical protein